MRGLGKALVGAAWGLLIGIPVLFVFECVLYGLGLVSVQGITWRETYRTDRLPLMALLGAVAAMPTKCRTAALLTAALRTLRLLTASLPEWTHGFGVTLSDLEVYLIAGVLGGASFGVLVNIATHGSFPPIERALRRIRPPRRRKRLVSRPRSEKTYRID
jgi:hypothetical protein